MEENIETKFKLNAREEVDNVISKTILEFQGTIENFELSKVKALIAKDEKRTVNLLFYGNDFIAINRVNFRNGYEYKLIEENSFKNKVKKMAQTAKSIALIIKNKLLKTNQVKMLSDGKDSVFDK